MKAVEIRELSDKEIDDKIGEEQENLTRLRMNHAVSPLEDTTKIKKTRKVIARLLTEQRHRELNK